MRYFVDALNSGSVIGTAASNFATAAHPTAVSGKISGLNFPYPTNSFWQNAVLGTNRIETSPYQVKPSNTQLWVCYPARTVNTTNITTAVLQNLSFESSETITGTAIPSYDLVSFTHKWSDANGNYMQSPIVQGMSYVTMEYHNLTPKIATQHAILNVNGTTTFPGTITGTKFKVVLNNSQTWLIYTSGTVSFDVQNSSGWRMLSTAAYKGRISMAYMKSAGFETILDSYSTCVPYGCNIETQFVGDTARMQYKWKSYGAGTLLMQAIPHFQDILISPGTVATDFVCMKGTTVGVLGNIWNIEEPLPTIIWSAPRSIDADKQGSISAALATDYTFTTSQNTSSYDFGKEIAKMARLALIADELGDTAKRGTIITNMQTWLNKWLDGTNGNVLKYDVNWGGVCTTNGLADLNADYGQAKYNDHHFHFGYMVYAAAVIARYDSSWKTTYTSKVNDLVRDYMSTSLQDTKYPRYRHKDFYAWHSWASGLDNFGDNRNQESTSESINSYYAAYLWGLAIGNTNMQNEARLLLAMEIRATKKYYHIYSGNSVYESGFTGKGVGVLWQTKIDDTTFFGANLEYRRMIQVIPITPITELYVEPTWGSTIYSEMSSGGVLGTATDAWKNFIYATQATYDKTTAWTNALTLSSFDNGNSKTNQLYWHATRP